MNLRDLEYVVAVANLTHFSRAAEYCNVSQPTLSLQIKKLEEELGVAIFERTNKQVFPTEAGLKIVQYARKILADTAQIKEIAKTAQDPFSGTFRLGAFPTLASYLFPSLVPILSKIMPLSRLVLLEEKSDTLKEMLKLGQIDATFLALPFEEDGFVVQHVFNDPFFIAVAQSHKLANKKSIDKSALLSERLLLLEEGHCLRDQALDLCQIMGSSNEPDFRATSLETLRQMVRANSGITIMPEIAINENKPDGISYIPFSEQVPFRSIALVCRKSCARKPVFDQIVTSLLEWRETVPKA